MLANSFSQWKIREPKSQCGSVVRQGEKSGCQNQSLQQAASMLLQALLDIKIQRLNNYSQLMLVEMDTAAVVSAGVKIMGFLLFLLAVSMIHLQWLYPISRAYYLEASNMNIGCCQLYHDAQANSLLRTSEVIFYQHTHINWNMVYC